MEIEKLTLDVIPAHANVETGSISPLGPIGRYLVIGLGFVFLMLACLGAALPLIPCTPFVLLAGYCFARSSPRLHQMLLRSRLFGQLIQDWQMRRAIHIKTKRFALLVVGLTLLATLCLIQPNLPTAIIIGGLMTVGVIVITRIPSYS